MRRYLAALACALALAPAGVPARAAAPRTCSLDALRTVAVTQVAPAWVRDCVVS